MYHAENWLDHDLRFNVHRRVRGEDKMPVNITYGYGEAWFGPVLAAFTDKGLCWFEPFPSPDAQASMAGLWAPATLREDVAAVQARLDRMLIHVDEPQALHLCGTAYQLRVWDALLCVPRGGTVSYGDLAKMMGNHRAARALGNAVGANNLALIVPCHRVKPVSGAIGKYRWGADLKRALLAREARFVAAAA